VWTARWNTQGTADDEGRVVRTDIFGNSFVVGRSKNYHTHWDVVLLKYLPSGALAPGFPRLYDNLGDDEPVAMELDSNGDVYVAISSARNGSDSNKDIVVRKWTNLGGDAWTDRYEATGGNDFAADIAIDVNNNVVVVGTLNATATNSTYLVRKLDSGGTVVWTQTFDFGTLPFNGRDEARAVAVHTDGAVWVTGATERTLAGDPYMATFRLQSSTGQMTWSDPHFIESGTKGGGKAEGIDVVVGPDGAGYATGVGSDIGNHWDFVTIGINADGTQRWQDIRFYDAPGARSGDYKDVPVGIGVVQERTGLQIYTTYVYVAGTSNYQNSDLDSDTASIKYAAASGALGWPTLSHGARRWKPNNQLFEGATDMVVRGSGNVYVTGRISTLTPGSEDYYTFRVDKDSNVYESTPIQGPSGLDVAESVFTMCAGRTHVTGRSYGGGTTLLDYLTAVFNFGSGLAPDNYIANIGSYVDGTLASLALSDNQYLVYDGDTPSWSFFPVVELEFRANYAGELSELCFKLEARGNWNPNTLEIWLYDQEAGNWVLLHTGSLQQSDSLVHVTVANDPWRFRGTQNQFRALVRCTALEQDVNWRVWFDVAGWDIVTP